MLDRISVNGIYKILIYFDVQTGLFRRLTGALVDENLLGDLLSVEGVLNEVDFQLRTQELGHGLLHELVVDGLLGLVFVRGLSGEVVADQNQTVLYVIPGQLTLVFLVFAQLLDISINGAYR